MLWAQKLRCKIPNFGWSALNCTNFPRRIDDFTWSLVIHNMSAIPQFISWSLQQVQNPRWNTLVSRLLWIFDAVLCTAILVKINCVTPFFAHSCWLHFRYRDWLESIYGTSRTVPCWRERLFCYKGWNWTVMVQSAIVLGFNTLVTRQDMCGSTPLSTNWLLREQTSSQPKSYSLESTW